MGITHQLNNSQSNKQSRYCKELVEIIFKKTENKEP